MLDSNALADLIAELVGDHVERATAPLIERIRELEGRPVVEPLGERLDALQRDLPSTIAEAVAPLVEERIAALPNPAPKEPDPDALRRMVDEAVAQMPPPEPGRDADMEAVAGMVADQVRAAVDAMPPPKPGEPGRNGHDVDDITVTQDGAVVEIGFTVGDTRTIFEIEMPRGPAGDKGDAGNQGPEGSLRAVRDWVPEGVSYEGDVVAHAGATWQAIRDTGAEPPSGDWRMLASAGRDGEHGRSFRVAETWDAEKAYAALDVVALNGGSFVARRDDPGICPGEGWQMLASRGKPGQPGERGKQGPKGDRGDAGPSVIALGVDEQGLLTLVNGDGSAVTCDLYPLLSRLA